MATITTITAGRFQKLQEATVQANTGQKQYTQVPWGAKLAYIDFNLTAVAGTSPLADLTFGGTDPVAKNDTYDYTISSGFTQITAAAHLHGFLSIVSGTNDTTTAATGDSNFAIFGQLPPILWIRLVFDRTTGDETYTYNLSVAYQ